MPIHWVEQRGLNGGSTPAALIHRTNYVAPPGGMLLLQTRTLFQKWNALIASLRDNRWWRALNCRASPLLHASPIQPTCPCAMLHCCQQSLQRYRGWKPLVIVTLYSWSGCSLRFNASYMVQEGDELSPSGFLEMCPPHYCSRAYPQMTPLTPEVRGQCDDPGLDLWPRM